VGVQLVDSDDAIVVPEDLQGRRRSLAWLTVALFALVCFGTLAVDVAWPAPRLVPIGGEAAREAALERNAKFSDGTLAALTDRRLRMTSRVRRWIATPYALGLHQHLNYTHGDVFTGSEGWLFQHTRTCAIWNEPVLRERLELHASMLASLALRLAALDCRLIVMPVPRKEVICAARIPDSIEMHAWAEPYVLASLRRRGVAQIDLADVWARAQSTEALYFRTGSHWTPEAERLAAEELARETGERVDPELRRTALVSTPTTQPDVDLLAIAGVEISVARASAPPGDYIAHRVLWKSNGVQAFFRNGPIRADYAVVGTSFTSNRMMWRLLAHAVDKPVALLSEGGGEPARQFFRLLEKRAGKPPRHLVYEIPMHLMLQMPPPASFESLASKLAVAAHTELIGFSYQGLKDGRLQLELTPARRDLGALHRSELFQDGSGWTHVRLRGSPGPEGVRVILRTSDTVREYDWPSELKELFVPVPALAMRSQDVLVSFAARAGASARLTLDSAHVVALGERALHRFSAAAPAAIVELTPLTTRLEARRVALVLKLSQPATKVGMTTATFLAYSGQQLVWRRDLVLREGVTTVVLDASELLGRDELSFRLECPTRPVGLTEGMLLGLGQP
jgi:hypothetical protein